MRGSKEEVIYDGSRFCDKGCCPTVVKTRRRNVVRISDSKRPERGAFTMSVEEYNAFIANAKPI